MVILVLTLPLVGAVVGAAVLWEALDRFFRGPELSGVLLGKLVPWFNRATAPICRPWVKHAEDAYMVNATLLYAVVIPSIFAMCAAHSITTGTVSVALVYFYHVFRIGPYFMNFAYVYTLCHKEGHCLAARNGLWAGPYDKKGVLRLVYNWWVGLFYGVMPSSFAVGHSINHHRYNNGPEDVVSTADKPRDNIFNFIAYIPRWVMYACNFSVVRQFIQEDNWPVVKKCLAGSAYYAAFVAVVAWIVSPKFALFYLCYPFLENVLLLACVNWSWHAFIDPADPTNEFVQSLTILGGPMNVLNEDAHVVHHQYPGVHWVQHTRLLRKHTKQYGKGSVFVATHAFEIFGLAVAGQYEMLADKFIGLVPEDEDLATLGAGADVEKLRSLQDKLGIERKQIIELLKQRLRACWWGPRAPDYSALHGKEQTFARDSRPWEDIQASSKELGSALGGTSVSTKKTKAL